MRYQLLCYKFMHNDFLCVVLLLLVAFSRILVCELDQIKNISDFNTLTPYIYIVIIITLFYKYILLYRDFLFLYPLLIHTHIKKLLFPTIQGSNHDTRATVLPGG